MVLANGISFLVAIRRIEYVEVPLGITSDRVDGLKVVATHKCDNHPEAGRFQD